MPAVNYVVHGCSSSTATTGVINKQELHTDGKILLQLLNKIDEDDVIGDRWQFEKAN